MVPSANIYIFSLLIAFCIAAPQMRTQGPPRTAQSSYSTPYQQGSYQQQTYQQDSYPQGYYQQGVPAGSYNMGTGLPGNQMAGSGGYGSSGGAMQYGQTAGGQDWQSGGDIQFPQGSTRRY